MLCANLVASPPRRRHGVRTKFLLTALALLAGSSTVLWPAPGPATATGGNSITFPDGGLYWQPSVMLDDAHDADPLKPPRQMAVEPNIDDKPGKRLIEI